jgi:hypothetical protein
MSAEYMHTKETIVVYFVVQSKLLSGVTEEKHSQDQLQ